MFVALTAPMKRGLKANVSNTVPNSFIVALTAPMKRGLKVQVQIPATLLIWCCTHCPDEKGTERAKLAAH